MKSLLLLLLTLPVYAGPLENLQKLYGPIPRSFEYSLNYDALIVVDVQKAFSGQEDLELLFRQRQVIRGFIYQDKPVILVLMGVGPGFLDTPLPIVSILKDYHKLSIVYKRVEDGSPGVLRVLPNCKTACIGGYLSRCLKATTKGIPGGVIILSCSYVRVWWDEPIPSTFLKVPLTL